MYAEAAELIQGPWISYVNTCRYDTVLAWIRRLPDATLSGDVHLLLVQAWVLSLSARREEAAPAIAAVERLGELGAGPLPDGFSSVEASLTMLRACFPWGDIGAQLETAAARPSLRAPGRPGGHWRAGRSAWACTSGVSPTRPTGGSRNRRRWRPRARSGWWRGVAGLPVVDRRRAGPFEEQRVLAETAAEFVREHGTEKVIGVAPLALGVSLAARGRPEEALPLIERGVALSRTFGQPIQLANALLSQAPVLRALGEQKRAADAIAEANPSSNPALIRGSWPGGWLLSTGHRRSAASDPEIRS